MKRALSWLQARWKRIAPRLYGGRGLKHRLLALLGLKLIAPRLYGGRGLKRSLRASR